MKADMAVIQYWMIAIMSGYGFLLFLWWFVKSGIRSVVYIYVMTLLAGICNWSIITLVMRYIYLAGDVAAHRVALESWWWPSRLWVGMVALYAIVGHMSYRAFWQRHRQEPELDQTFPTNQCRLDIMNKLDELHDKFDELHEKMEGMEETMRARKEGFQKLLDTIP